METIITAYADYFEETRNIIRTKDDFINLTDAIVDEYADEIGGLTGADRAAISGFVDRLLLNMCFGEEFHVGEIVVQCLPAGDERLKDL